MITDKEYRHMDDKELFKLMAGSSRLKRKNAAKELAQRVKEKPEYYISCISHFIDALSRPEAQTRWECLNALSALVPLNPKACSKAIDGAEEALFDDKTNLIRVAAIRFLCRYGALSVLQSKEVWYLIKDALLQYHGEIEFDEMLIYVIHFAQGKLSSVVKKEFVDIVNELISGVGPRSRFRLQKVLDCLNGKNTNKETVKKVSKKKTSLKSKNENIKKKVTKKVVKTVAKKAVNDVKKKSIAKKSSKGKTSKKA